MGNRGKPSSAPRAETEKNANDLNETIQPIDTSVTMGKEAAGGAGEAAGYRDEIKAYLMAEPDEKHREALSWFIDYMGDNHPGLKPVISYGIPTYKLGGKRRYVAFSLAKDHYTFHSTDFDIIDELRGKIPGAGKGRGSIHLKYDDPAVRAVVVAAIAAIVSREGD